MCHTLRRSDKLIVCTRVCFDDYNATKFVVGLNIVFLKNDYYVVNPLNYFISVSKSLHKRLVKL
jgi:hypothetical protein